MQRFRREGNLRINPGQLLKNSSPVVHRPQCPVRRLERRLVTWPETISHMPNYFICGVRGARECITILSASADLWRKDGAADSAVLIWRLQKRSSNQNTGESRKLTKLQMAHKLKIRNTMRQKHCSATVCPCHSSMWFHCCCCSCSWNHNTKALQVHKTPFAFDN